MKNDAYWKERMQIMEQTRYDGDVQTYHEIERIYDRAIAETEKEIRAWYNRFAENNGITLADANKLLTDKELAELKWDVNEYINRGRENAIDSRWKKELENASARYHISRLESIKLQIQQRAESVMGSEQDLLDKHVREIYSDTYYHTAYEIQRGTGVGWQLERLDDRRIDAVIKKPWAVDGSNFSERIWNQRDKLVNTLHQELTQSIIRGEDPERAIAALTKTMGNSKSNARRLIMTESAAFASRSQQDCYNDLDVEKYKIVATLDNVTCDICGGLDGKVFKMSEYAVGSTAPPFHPNCRTVTVPYFEDDKNAVRAARGADGKTYTIPADTKYKEWKKAMVDGGENPFKVEPERIPVEIPKSTPEPKGFVNMNGNPIVFAESMNQPNRLKSKKILETLCGEYNTRLSMVRVATPQDAKEMKDVGGLVDFSGLMRLRSTKLDTAIHEFAHSFALSADASKGLYDRKTEEFWKEIRKAYRDYRKDYRYDYSVSISFYSFDNVDEFMAEAFTAYKAKQMGVPLSESYHINEKSQKYIDRVGSIIDKYFRKPENEIPIAPIQPPKGAKNVVNTKINNMKCTISTVEYGFSNGILGQSSTKTQSICYTLPDGTNFYFKMNMDPKNQTMNPEQVIEAWRNTPKEIRANMPKTIEIVDFENPKDSFYRKMYKNFTSSYATGGDRITFWKHSNEHDTQHVIRTFCHETGHVLDLDGDGYGKITKTNEWTNAVERDTILSNRAHPTDYSENSPKEDFAESVAEYITNKTMFKKYFPNRAKIIERLLFKRGVKK